VTYILWIVPAFTENDFDIYIWGGGGHDLSTVTLSSLQFGDVQKIHVPFIVWE